MKNLTGWHNNWKLSVVNSLVLGGSITLASCLAIASSGNYAWGQITSDGTVGSQVSSPIPGAFLINGGATRGSNLFHSFSEFSVPSNGLAYFNNLTPIQNIITRVTGGSVSNIDGVIRANGTANLFFLNPKGIIFRPNAQLQIGGSFLASTANSLNFADGTKFSATASQTTPLLTVSVPVGLQYGNNVGNIQIQGSELRVNNGQTLALVGGNVQINNAFLDAPGGRIEIGGLSQPGTVGLNVDGNKLRLSFPSDVARADVSLTNGSVVNSSGKGSGDIQLVGGLVTLTDSSQIVANTLGAAPGGEVSLNSNQLFILNGARVAVTTYGSGQGGTLKVTASEFVELRGGLSVDGRRLTGLFTATRNTGNAGDLTIATGQLVARQGAQVFSGTFNRGKGGNLTVFASNSVSTIGTTLDGNFVSGLFAQTKGSGDAGNLRIITGKLLVRDGSQVSTSTFGKGQSGTLDVFASESIELVGGTNKFPSGLRSVSEKGASGDAGALIITTEKLIVRDGAAVVAATLTKGKSGTLTVTASKSVELIGTSADGSSASTLSTQTEGSGDAGVLKIVTGQLILRDGAQILASTFDKGRGGVLEIIASEFVQVIGGTLNFPTGLQSTSEGSGDAGSLSITTEKLIIRDGGQVAAATLGEGKGGKLTVIASQLVELSGSKPEAEAPSGLFTRTEGPKDAGELRVVTGKLIVRDGARVEANTLGAGRGGTLDVTASDSVEVIGTTPDSQFGSGILAQSNASGAAGDLRITTGELIVRDGAQVSVSSDGTGKAGDLKVTANFIRLDNQGELIAETASGQGGNITLNVKDVLLMRHGSRISTTAGTAKLGGDGGNIGIDSLFIVAVPKENSDITANAYTGKGGNINITTQGIYGLEFRPRLTPFSDITASSEFGVNGNVQINTSGIDPNRGLNNLPVEPVTTEVAEDCQGQGKPGSVAFFNTGKGGLAPNPYEPKSSSNLWEDVSISTSGTANFTSPSQTIVEAQSWIVNEKGEVVLVAEIPVTRSPGRCRLR